MPVTTTTATLKATTPALHPALRQLERVCRDVITGETTTALVPSNVIVAGMDLVFKNGSLLTPTTAYTVNNDGRGITLGVAAIAGDVFVIWYFYRTR